MLTLYYFKIVTLLFATIFVYVFRWKKTLNPHRERVGKWDPDEDKRLKIAISLFGARNWNKMSKFVPGRTQVQCRERYH